LAGQCDQLLLVDLQAISACTAPCRWNRTVNEPLLGYPAESGEKYGPDRQGHLHFGLLDAHAMEVQARELMRQSERTNNYPDVK
jgi:hypothetical protein